VSTPNTAHDWQPANNVRPRAEWCALCGVVKRRDGRNGPCVGRRKQRDTYDPCRSPCPYPRHTRIWVSIHGNRRCGTCCPPADESLVAHWE
jgi:hypothetical protein